MVPSFIYLFFLLFSAHVGTKPLELNSGLYLEVDSPSKFHKHLGSTTAAMLFIISCFIERNDWSIEKSWQPSHDKHLGRAVSWNQVFK